MEELFAHGISGTNDLPLPFEYALIGASWALSISFAILGLAWKTARYQDHTAPKAPPRSWPHAIASLAGLGFTALFAQALFWRTDPLAALGTFYVLLWVGIVPLALLFGHIWRDISPFRTVQRWVYRIAGRTPDAGFIPYPRFLGYWPAALGLFAFVWLELVSPHGIDINWVRGWLITYAGLMIIGSLIFGSRWFERADPFDVYSALVAHLSPTVENGRFRLHNPLRTLPQIPVDYGLVALVSVLLGSTAFDSFAATPSWQVKGISPLGNTLVLLLIIAIVAIFFWLAAIATGGISWRRRLELPGLMAHSLLPIVVGYVFAHYLSYFVELGHQTVLLLFGLDGEPTTFLTDHPGLLAGVKVSGVLLGHVVAVVSAHDRALALLPKAHRLTGQLAMLLVMVGFTVAGLYLLFDM